jgi:hypothetical protein
MPDRVGVLLAIALVAAALYVWYRLCGLTIDLFLTARQAKPSRRPAPRQEEREPSGSE